MTITMNSKTRQLFESCAQPLGLSRTPLIFAALGIQGLAIAVVQNIDFTTARTLLALSYGTLLYALLPNLKQPPVTLIFVGAALNFLVILVNGGAMPTDAGTLRLDPTRAGEDVTATGFLPFSKDILLPPDHIHLRFLADILTLPGAVRIAFSVGDAVISVGILALLLGRLASPRAFGWNLSWISRNVR